MEYLTIIKYRLYFWLLLAVIGNLPVTEKESMVKRISFLNCAAVLSLLGWFGATGAAKAEEVIWIEGEAATANTMKTNPWYSDMVKKEELSGGKMLSHFAPGAAPEASYLVKAASAGEYFFWARMNPIAAPEAAYDLNGAGWTAINFAAHTDNRNIANNGAPDMRFLAWVNLGKVTLKSGENTVKFRFSSKNQNHGSLDCFFFSPESVSPVGKMPPGKKLGLAEEGMWAFEPDADKFSKDSLLDLSYLNTPFRKDTPFLTVNKDGDFSSGGKTVRFWAVNTMVQDGANIDEMKRYGHWLAKRGVNLVRWHGHLPSDEVEGPTKLEDVDKRALDSCFKLVAGMRENGIYTCVSPYWGPYTKNKKSWGLTQVEGNNLAAVVFWDKQVQGAYKQYLKALFTTPNPYSGIMLKDDPAVAIILLQNEDSMLFWTTQAVKGKVLDDLMGQFAAFAAKKYGSLDKAYAAWDNFRLKTDNPAENRLGMDMLWELTQIRAGGQEKRKCDQFEFLCRLMRDFNESMGTYLREELGCKQVVNPGNWRTAADQIMLDGERFSYAGNEVIGVNRYKSTVHEGPRNGYLVAPGDTYANSSILLDPASLPVAVKQVAGKAMIIPESSWVAPEKYQSEGPLLVAAYSSLNGVDSLIWWCHDKPGWNPVPGKWILGTPMVIGQFPAAALIFRQGYVKRGAPVVHEERPLADIWQRKTPLLAEGQAFDPNRDTAAAAAGGTAATTEVSPLAFLAGPVEVVFGGDPAKNKVADLSRLIDSKAGTVTSETGQLKLDYKQGVFTMNAPQAQGVSGWISKEKEVKLADVTIAARNEYATIYAVSLDGKPLKTAAKVLVQIGTINHPYGMKEEKTTINRKGLPPLQGFKILDLGQAIWNVEKADATLRISNSGLSEAVVLDVNGMPVRTIKLEKSGSDRTLTLPADALYVVLR